MLAAAASVTPRLHCCYHMKAKATLLLPLRLFIAVTKKALATLSVTLRLRCHTHAIRCCWAASHMAAATWPLLHYARSHAAADIQVRLPARLPLVVGSRQHCFSHITLRHTLVGGEVLRYATTSYHICQQSPCHILPH